MIKERLNHGQLLLLTASLLFLFNMLTAKIVDTLQSFQPPAYDIATGSLQKLGHFMAQNWRTYTITLVGYLVIWGLLVTLAVTIMLLSWHQLNRRYYIKALKSGQIHLSVLLMLLLSVPLTQIGFKFPVAYYLTMPKTFIDVIQNPIIWCLSVVSYLILLWLAFRLHLVAYFAITTAQGMKKNIKQSWQETRQQNRSVLYFGIKLLGCIALVIIVLFLIQKGLDQFLVGEQKRWIANALIAIGIGYFYIVTSQCYLFYTALVKPETQSKSTKSLLMGVSYLGILMIIGIFSSFLSGKFVREPNKNTLVIAHKGIASEKQAPNTLATLTQVAQTKPDFVEIDIQPTRDGVYVLSHDGDIKATDGKSYKIDETSWQTLKTIRYRTKGQTLRVTSFNDYISRANQLHQKLLVELKISDTITTQALLDFQNRYGQALKANHAQLQSLNQNIIKRLSEHMDQPMGLLSPVVNSIDGAKFSHFYAIEYSNANANLSQRVTQYHKALYVWTLNQKSDIATAYALGVTGYITDYPKQTRALLTQFNKQARYADVIWQMVMLQKTNI